MRRDEALLQELGWEEFVRQRRPRGDFASLDNVEHSAQRILKEYKAKGVPVHFSTAPWSNKEMDAAIDRGKEAAPPFPTRLPAAADSRLPFPSPHMPYTYF